jgi:hypothetical protein
MSIFGKDKHIDRQEFRKKLEKASSKIPGSSKEFNRAERIKLEKEVFGKKFGELITKQEFKRRLLKMRGNKYRAKTSAEKLKLGRKMRYLEKLSDIDV